MGCAEPVAEPRKAMKITSLHTLLVAPLLSAGAPALAAAQAPVAIAKTACGTEVAAPAALPPAGSPPFIWVLELCFDRQGNSSTVDNDTYLYWIKLPTSQPSQGKFVSYDDRAEQQMIADFKALWDTKFLEDLSIEKTEHTFENGTVGVMVVYRMEERERVKIVDYRNTKGDSISIIKRSDIDDKLRERNIEVRLDSFLDEGSIRRVKGVLRELMAEKGFTNADINHKVTPVAGGPKLVNVTFTVGEGPKIKIRAVDFIGNQAVSDGKLEKKMKENKPKGLLSFITGGGTYKESMYEEDAARVVEFYRNEGYPQARVGNPEVKTLRRHQGRQDAVGGAAHPGDRRQALPDGRVGVRGQQAVPERRTAHALQGRAGGVVQQEKDRRREQEGAGSVREPRLHGVDAVPDVQVQDDPNNPETALAALVPPALAVPVETNGNSKAQAETSKPPVVDVTMQITEGPQYFVNRITFTGNTTTRDNVIRREMRLIEGNVFDTEALKYSVRRLNQLGYFKELKGNDSDMKVDKTPGKENNVDVTLKFEEQNRNQLTFGAGVSQYEGLFGQLAFQTSNFLGRGESLTVSVQAGDRAQNYQLAFSEPFLFDRNITGGFDIYKRSLQYIGYYTQKSTGGNLVFGFPVADFSRMFFNYSYETIRITDLNEALIDQSCLLRPQGCSTISSVGDLSQLTQTQIEVLRRNPFVYDSLFIGQGGERTISKVTPSFVHNTVDNPIFPNQGKRLTASIDLAVLGGNTNFLKPRLEGI